MSGFLTLVAGFELRTLHEAGYKIERAELKAISGQYLLTLSRKGPGSVATFVDYPTFNAVKDVLGFAHEEDPVTVTLPKITPDQYQALLDADPCSIDPLIRQINTSSHNDPDGFQAGQEG